MEKTERISPRTRGREPARFLLGRGDDVEQIDVALVGRLNIERQRPQRRPAGGLEHHRHAAVIQSQATEFLGPMRRQETGFAAQSDELPAQVFRSAVRGLPFIVFIGNDSFRDKALNAIAQFRHFARQLEIDHAFLRADYSLAARRASSMPRANKIGIEDAKRSHRLSVRLPVR
jgi:hypothetical protein